MKITVAFVTIMFFSMTKGMAQEHCSKFYPMQEGTKFQITSYDKKDKVTTVLDYVVKSSTGNVATLAYESHDDKGKLMFTSEYDLICEEEGIAIDFKSLISPDMLDQYQNMEVEVTGTNVLFPNNLTAGETLPDADMLMKVKIEPINMKLNVKIYNRKVEGKESISTPAGTFDCFVITYDFDTKMGVKITGRVKQWLAEGVGMVKTINYSKNGKANGSSELTKFEE